MRNNNFIINSLSIYHLLQIILMLSHMKGARDKRKTIRDETRDKKLETRNKILNTREKKQAEQLKSREMKDER